MRYWVRINKQSVGPLTPEEIAKHPEITEGTLVCPEDKAKSTDWVRLRAVPSLMALCARQVPPPMRRSIPAPLPKDLEQPPPHPPSPPPLPTNPQGQQETNRSTYRCASCERDFSAKGQWEKHRLNCENLNWVQEPQRIARVAPAAGGMAWLVGLMQVIALCWVLYLGYSMVRGGVASSSSSQNNPIPEISYRGDTGNFVDCYDFGWRPIGELRYGGDLKFKVRFKKEFAFGSFRVFYEARDQSGSVILDSGRVGEWTGTTNPATSFEESIFLSGDKAQRTRKIIFSAESESMFSGLFPGVTRH